jgi:predicted enzyme related to lactoylglutathione lyase
MPNTVDYVEIPSRDVRRSKAFFEALVGWRFTDYGPDYVSFEDGRINGGFFTSDKVSSVASGATLAVIYSEHLERQRELAIKLGATITKDTFSFPGGRRFHFTEPGGSEFSIWSDK